MIIIIIIIIHHQGVIIIITNIVAFISSYNAPYLALCIRISYHHQHHIMITTEDGLIIIISFQHHQSDHSIEADEGLRFFLHHSSISSSPDHSFIILIINANSS
jgi:hypothetical protein